MSYRMTRYLAIAVNTALKRQGSTLSRYTCCRSHFSNRAPHYHATRAAGHTSATGIHTSATVCVCVCVCVYIYKYIYSEAEPHGTENIFHIGQISALYKINNTDSSGRDYRICSHWEFPPYSSSALYKFHCRYTRTHTMTWITALSWKLPLGL
jgi:hypothetical protein